MAMNRRTILTSAALAGAGALMARSPIGARAQEQTDVIVLGAGLSGLHAAGLLEEVGKRVLVLEGRDRVGGKILTYEVNGGHVELGGQSMGAGYGRAIDAAERNNVELYNYLPRFMNAGAPELVLDGKVIAKDTWENSPLNPFTAPYQAAMPWDVAPRVIAEGNPLRDSGDWVEPASFKHDTSLHAFLTKQGMTDAQIDLAYDTIVGYGTSAHDVSALMMFFVDAWNRMQQQVAPISYGARQGNSKITEAMAASLSSEPRLGQEVVAIESTSDGVDVRCRDGSRYSARAAICTFPFSTLRNVHVSPVLIGAQRMAVQTLPFMKITMVVIEAKSPYWEKDGLNPSMWTDGPIGTLTALRYGESDDEVTALTAWARGNPADYLDRLGPKATKERVVREIEAIRPAAKGQVKAVHVHSWGLDRLSACAWAVFAPGQVAAFVNDMAKPHGNLFFCGEHTAKVNRGMEGALESAERAVFEAIEII